MGSISESLAAGGCGRQQILKKLGIASAARAHELILEGLKRGSSIFLTQLGLSSQRLIALGYSVDVMHRLGFDDATLLNLGFKLEDLAQSPAPTANPSFEEDHSHNLPHYFYHFDQHSSRKQAPLSVQRNSKLLGVLHHDPHGDEAAKEIRKLVGEGCKAPGLKAREFTMEQIQHAGYLPCDLKRLGFELAEMARVYSAFQLKQAGYGAAALRRHYNGEKLRKAGFEAAELREAGYGVRELLRLGYDETRVSLAGYSAVELADGGLARVKRK